MIVSTHAGVTGSSKLKRFDNKTKTFVAIKCPNIMTEYSTLMGGVDFADVLIELYRTRIIIKKRWYLKLMLHAIDIAKVNAWLFYHRQCLQLQVPKIISFRYIINFYIITKLNHKDKDPQKLPGRPAKQNLSPIIGAVYPPVVSKLNNDVQYDGYSHWPEVCEKRGRCRKCDMTCSMELQNAK